MKISGKVLMSLSLLVVSAWMVITALKWPLKTSLFPVVIGIPVFSLAIFELYFSLSRKEGKEGSRVDFKLSESTDQALANRRTISIFFWILGFFLLIVLVGFPIAVPLFFILFLNFYGKEKWRISLGMAALAYAFFFGLFIWLLNTPFQEGWVQKGLRVFGIL